MKYKFLTFFLSILIFSCTKKESNIDEGQFLAICEQGNGCEFSELKVPSIDIDRLLKIKDFWVKSSSNATLILENCKPSINETETLDEIDLIYGGNGNVRIIDVIDLEKYLADNECFSCPNKTKKFSFKLIDKSGKSRTSYFYLNIKQNEAFMPQKALQKLNDRVQNLTIDLFIRNGKLDQFTINPKGKIHSTIPLSKQISISGIELINFKEKFNKTSETRVNELIKTPDTQYVGNIDGEQIIIWMTPSEDTCLLPGKFNELGFYSLGYIAMDGITYLITEVQTENFHVQLTDIENSNYSFDNSAYKTSN